MPEAKDRLLNGTNRFGVSTALRVVLLYENSVAGRKARQLSGLTLKRLGHDGGVAVSGWRFDRLNAPGVRDAATREVRGADLIVVALCSRACPEGLRLCLDDAFERKETVTRLVVLLDRLQGMGLACEPAVPRLQAVADGGRLAFFAASAQNGGWLRTASTRANGDSSPKVDPSGSGDVLLCTISARKTRAEPRAGLRWSGFPKRPQRAGTSQGKLGRRTTETPFSGCSLTAAPSG